MQAWIDDAIAATRGSVRWSVRVMHDGEIVADIDSATTLPTASMGKVFLLAEVARRIADGSLDPSERMHALPNEMVADSGLWQHLTEPTLSVASLAVLVASVSDNIAANVLLRRVGLADVQRVSDDLGMPQTRVLDGIRDNRGPEHPSAPSVGRADDLARLMSLVAGGEALGPIVSGTLAGWLSLNSDLSMVASALGLDPLAHAAREQGVRLFNKTGTDAGVRADAGHVAGSQGGVSYAAIAVWQPDGPELASSVMASMRRIGDAVRRASGV